MDQHIEKLLEYIENGSPEEKLSCLMDIGDHIDLAHPNDEDLRTIVQRLVNAAAKETDKKVQGNILRIISKAYMQRVDLAAINFEPLISTLANGDPDHICNVIYLLSMTWENKYIPLISEYTAHSDEKIRSEAESALEYLTRK